MLVALTQDIRYALFVFHNTDTFCLPPPLDLALSVILPQNPKYKTGLGRLGVFQEATGQWIPRTQRCPSILKLLFTVPLV
jgi:hypothetical protein